MKKIWMVPVVAVAATGLIGIGGGLGRLPTYTVQRVIDGDTIVLTNGETVRLIGIDTPERGQCGYQQARSKLESLVGGKTVGVEAGARTDKDRYGRILRYVYVDGQDAGFVLIDEGFAIARYDSRDGYGRHPKQEQYIAEDLNSPNLCP